MSRLMVMAGGTGGHVMPALAVARLLRDKGVDIRWIGNPEGLEAKLVPAAGFELETIHIKGLRKSGLVRKLVMPLMLFGACFQVLKIVLRYKPDALLGMGGFVSGPGGLVGGLMGKPLVLHEQNAVAGLTNRALAPLAKRVLSGFPQALGIRKAQWVGNPVRADISAVEDPKTRLNKRDGPLRILVIGGSQGAQVFNEHLPILLKKSELPAIDVWHQCGDGRSGPVKKAYQEQEIMAKPVDFVNDMAEALSWSDIVICRAGAMTVAEVCAAGVVAMFVPYPSAVSDHQTLNAQHLVQEGAAFSYSQDEFVEGEWLEQLVNLSSERNRLIGMADLARSLAKPDATKEVAEICEGLMNA